jgi:hypothetical protein
MGTVNFFSKENILRGKIYAERTIISEANGRKHEAEQELADLICPYNVGDILESKTRKRTETFMVSRISPSSYESEDFSIWARQIKKDETLSHAERILQWFNVYTLTTYKYLPATVNALRKEIRENPCNDGGG